MKITVQDVYRMVDPEQFRRAIEQHAAAIERGALVFQFDPRRIEKPLNDALHAAVKIGIQAALQAVEKASEEAFDEANGAMMSSPDMLQSGHPMPGDKLGQGTDE